MPAMAHQPVSLSFWATEVLRWLAYYGLIPGVAAGYGGRKLQQRRRQRQAAMWPSAMAEILWGHVDNIGRWPFPEYWAEITYNYYAGEYRSGTYVRRFRREDDADEFIRQIKSKQIQVHYPESDPEHSVILERDLEMLALLTPQIR